MAVFKEEQSEIKHLTIKPFVKVFKYALRSWPLLLLGAIGMILTSYYDASLTPQMNRAIISAVDNGVVIGSIWDINVELNFLFGLKANFTFLQFAIFATVTMIFRAAAIFLTFYTVDMLALKITNVLRLESFKKVQELSFSYFDKTPTGWILARMENDTTALSEVLSWGVMRFFWTIFEILFLLVTMFSASWQLTLLVLALSPVIAILAPIFQHFMLKLHRIARNAYSNYVRWLSECINGVSTIKTLSIEDKVYSEATDIIEDIRKKRRKAITLGIVFTPFVDIVSSLTIALLILFSYPNINNTAATIIIDSALLILFTSSVSHIYRQIADFSELYTEFVSNQTSAEKIMELIDAKPELVDNEQVVSKYGSVLAPMRQNYINLEGNIEFKNINFEYIKDVPVIKDLNLKIKKGTRIAIVGETGSGKTTTVNLLCRFYEPQSGEILLDGINYKDISVGNIRSSISYVQQNPFVFSGTYKDNIKYGKEDASDEEMIKAAKMVGIHDFIASQENGYDTKLIDGGNQLSLGQKQLISFARAILRDPKILILDEATSSIDSKTEYALQGAIEKMLNERTSIIIAHRLSTIVNSDRIIMMENGQIVEDGSHKELMAKRGKYFNLYMSQFRELDIDTQLNVYKAEQKL